jgi:hypothetical protein
MDTPISKSLAFYDWSESKSVRRCKGEIEKGEVGAGGRERRLVNMGGEGREGGRDDKETGRRLYDWSFTIGNMVDK